MIQTFFMCRFVFQLFLFRIFFSLFSFEAFFGKIFKLLDNLFFSFLTCIVDSFLEHIADFFKFFYKIFSRIRIIALLKVLLFKFVQNNTS